MTSLIEQAALRLAQLREAGFAAPEPDAPSAPQVLPRTEPVAPDAAGGPNGPIEVPPTVQLLPSSLQPRVAEALFDQRDALEHGDQQLGLCAVVGLRADLLMVEQCQYRYETSGTARQESFQAGVAGGLVVQAGRAEELARTPDLRRGQVMGHQVETEHGVGFHTGPGGDELDERPRPLAQSRPPRATTLEESAQTPPRGRGTTMAPSA